MTANAVAPLLLHVFPTFAVGGAQIRTAALMNRFADRYRHHVVAMDGVYGCAERIAPGVDITYSALRFAKKDTLGSIRQMRQALRDIAPDVLVTSNWGSLEWAMANVPRLVRHIHMEDGFGPDERDRQLPRRVWTRRLVLRGSTVVVPSRVLEGIARDVWKLPPATLRYVANGVDRARFAVAEAMTWPGEGPVIGMVAALRPEKNPSRLLRAFALVRATAKARLVIVGDGPERLGLETLARSLGVADDVHFTGHLGATECAYRGFDLFALSSDTEQMPLSVLEAMAAGRAVAATDVGDTKTMVSPENVPFLTSRDDRALANAIKELLADPDRRAHIGRQNAIRCGACFDQETMFENYAALYDSGIDARAAA